MTRMYSFSINKFVPQDLAVKKKIMDPRPLFDLNIIYVLFMFEGGMNTMSALHMAK